MAAGVSMAAFAYQRWKKESFITTISALEWKTRQSTSVIQEPGQFVEGLKVFTSDDVAKHQD